MTNDKQIDSIKDIGCLEAIEQIYAYLDGELTEAEVTDFEHHMGHCRSCFSRKELETELTKKLKKSSKEKIPDSLQNRLKNLIDNF